ncbi:MAG: alpha/beta hydrolase [Synergistetes bacterium]|nr:alpha/beta hydrolase [Synergistota bacterium]
MRAEDWKSFIYELPKNFDLAISSDVREEGDVFVRRLSFESLYKSPYDVNNRVYVDVFIPKERKLSSLLLFVHGLGITKRRKVLYSLLPRKLARLGVRSAFLTLPYHLERTPAGKPSALWFRDFNDVETAAFFHQSVLDARVALRILNDGSSPFIAGISLGAMIAAITLAMEESLVGGFLILGGANLERIVWRSLVRLFMNEEGCSRGECHRHYRIYPRYLREVERRGSFREVELPKICFLFDPLTFAPLLRRKKVVMINSLFDMVIPPKSALELWEGLGRPEIHWLPSTHGLTVFFGNRISNIIFDKIKGEVSER